MGRAQPSPRWVQEDKERLPGPKTWGYTYLYTSNHTINIETNSAFFFLHKISTPAPAKPSNNLFSFSSSCGYKTLKNGFGCPPLLIGVLTPEFRMPPWTLRLPFLPVVPSPCSSPEQTRCAAFESAWDSQDHREAWRYTVCAHKVSQPLDFPTTYAQKQLCFDSLSSSHLSSPTIQKQGVPLSESLGTCRN